MLRIGHVCSNTFELPPSIKNSSFIFAPGIIQVALNRELVEMGHKVFVFTSKNAKTKGIIVHQNMPAISLIKNKFEKIEYQEGTRYYYLKNAQKAFEMAKNGRLDIIHIHEWRYGIFFAKFVNIPIVISLHDPAELLNRFDLIRIKEAPKNVFFVSLSKTQQKKYPKINFIGTAYNGVDTNKFKFIEKPKNYFVASGRIIPGKGIDIACQIARKTGIKLKIAGQCIGPKSQAYFDKKIKPYLKLPNISYLGLVSHEKMPSLFGNARGLIMPILAEESFGLVMIEAMSCGTPVIAFNKSTAPEIIKNKQTGFVVNDKNEMIKAIKNIDLIKRDDCRQHVLKNYTFGKMAKSYENIYLQAIKKCKK